MLKIMTVSELSVEIKDLLENNFLNVSVKGEFSNIRESGAGHVYFSIKDEGALINCVLFRYLSSKNKKFLKEGKEGIVKGRISVFIPRGSYQIIVNSISLSGVGELYTAFEELKVKLKEEGLFDLDHKKAIPIFPRCLGVVTAENSAAFRDILKISAKLSPETDIVLYPALVQGKGAASTIIKGIELLNKINGVDVIIIGRGGGSMEDLWEFNDPDLARAIYSSEKPIISAVGHEIDFTISDFTADLRAATPTAGAEVALRGKRDALENYLFLKNELFKNIDIFIEDKRKILDAYPVESFINRLERYYNDKVLDLDRVNEIFLKAIKHYIERSKQHLERIKVSIKALSPEGVLRRGYSVVRKGEGIVRDASLLMKGDEIEIIPLKGLLKAEVKKREEINIWESLKNL